MVVEYYIEARKKPLFSRMRSLRKGREIFEYSRELVKRRCDDFADFIDANQQSVGAVLRGYATTPAIVDEIERSIDLLRNVTSEVPYFGWRVNSSVSLLPRNQLLYSTVYQGVIVANLSRTVHLRAPQSARSYYEKLIDTLALNDLFPEIEFSWEPHKQFTSRTCPSADVVLLAGGWDTGVKIRERIGQHTFMTISGAGHNPIIIWQDADVKQVVEAVIRLCLLNSGQDCSAPNTILVARDRLNEVISTLRSNLDNVMNTHKGPKDFDHILGPNTDSKHVVNVSNRLRKAEKQIQYGGQVDIENSVIYPAILVRELTEGIGLDEHFAPIILLQPFDEPDKIARFLASDRYKRRAMYLTHWGNPPEGFSLAKLTHPDDTILKNTDLHVAERGTIPYGGYGPEASVLCTKHEAVASPILPQREIYSFCILPCLCKDENNMSDATKKQNDKISSDPVVARTQKLNKLRETGIDPYPATFRVTHKAGHLQRQYETLKPDERTEDKVVVAGRVLSQRNSGMFRDIRDGTGKIQIFTHKEFADEDSILLKSFIDIGDFIGVEGTVRRTQSGELTVNAEKITILTKSLLPLPEKYHGITDAEARQRNRSLDLIGNDDSREVFKKRSQVISAIRTLMSEDGFTEIETPVLHAIYGGASADPFTTHYNAVHRDMYLRIALELHLKRTLVGGLSDKIFEIGRVFRNEGVSTRHNPEFTMLEAYSAYSDYNDMMALVEMLFKGVSEALHGSASVKYGIEIIDFNGPFKRLPMPEAVKDKTGIDFLSIRNDKDARNVLINQLNVNVEDDATWGECLEEAFANFVEPTLIQPTHVTGFPKDISPLAKTDKEDPRLVERFETFVNGWELANAFSELNDPIEQRARMEEQMHQAHARGEISREVDEEFLAAIEQGMPPTGGLGIGVDRLVMLMTDCQTIRDVILYPALRAKS